MNENQHEVFNQVIEAVNHPFGGQRLFFIDEPGTTSYLLLLEQILTHVRLQRKTAILVAFSGNAAALLTRGHTALSRCISCLDCRSFHHIVSSGRVTNLQGELDRLE